MSEDLKSMSVEELRNEVSVRLEAYGQNGLLAFDELARRLEEAQRENTELRHRLALISEITDKALQAVSEDSAR